VRLWAPLAGFALLMVVVAIGLWRPADRAVRSALVGKPLPALSLPPSVPALPGVDTGRAGGARLVNVFASWCVPCAAEAPQLMALKAAGVRIEGVAVRDAPADTAAFLQRHGNPFAAIGDDREGRFQLSVGSSGVPETFVVDAKGRIAMQHIGPIMDADVPAIVAALRGVE
jgi:cytochrome c biogenesis protein CcmG, thiol:disulfide interchange protein DsbE